jgi:hypothetical protein
MADGLGDIFLARFDANGNVIWAKRAGGNDSDFCFKLAVDAAGNCYLTGVFESVTAHFLTSR